jgi:hypothetical protein
MDNPDDWLNPPPDDAVLWRYMDFAKFVSILAKKSLFFTRADKLGDLFEGYWPLLDSYSSIASGYKAVIPLALINCWHESPHESEAMWRLYSRETDGIAIKTNFGSLRQSFTTSQFIRLGRINYIDYKTRFSGSGTMERPFFFKRKSFEHEREVRAVILDLDDENIQNFSPRYDVGNYYEVDISILIHEVVVAPYAQDWFLELVQSVADRYKLKAPVVKSRLAEPPTWVG